MPIGIIAWAAGSPESAATSRSHANTTAARRLAIARLEPDHWRWLMDTCRFTPAEAQAVASWGIGALIGALKTDPSGLDRLPVPLVANDASGTNQGKP
jgi:hypothetical protein